MDLPIDIKNILEDILLSQYPMDKIKESSFNIIHKYNYESYGDNHINNELDAKVYSVIRYPATYNAFYDALRHSLECSDNNITSILDVGGGSGAASLASLSILNNVKDITILEKEDVMIDIGKYLFSKLDLSNIVRYQKSDITTYDISHQYDLVCSSYVLNELDESKILSVIDKMWDSTNKILLVVEPGTPKGFSIIKIVRDYLISKGGYIISPCPHMNKCPLPNSDWCHFSTRISRSKLHKLLKGGDAPYEDEKYSYIAFSKSPCERCDSRVLRHPKISSGYIELELCSRDGLETIKVTKKDKDKFKVARKIFAGDTI